MDVNRYFFTLICFNMMWFIVVKNQYINNI